MLRNEKTFSDYGFEDGDYIASNDRTKEYTIIIQNLEGDKKSIVVDISDTISIGKSLYGNESYIWKYDGQLLKDEKTFSYYGFEDGDYIYSHKPRMYC